MLLQRVDASSRLAGLTPDILPLVSKSVTGGNHTRAPVRVLMIAGLFTLPYRVMRCARAAGAVVYVLGNDGARGFRFSRFCEKFVHTRLVFDGSFDEAMADEVNSTIGRFGIDMVLAGDQPSARSLIGLRPMLTAPCFPMPDLATFDLLNDKWTFFALCNDLGVRCPPTILLPDTATLQNEIDSGRLALPLVIKPTALDGSRGVLVLSNDDDRKKIDSLRYAPVLVQQFVPGSDIGASAFCRNGEILGFVVHKLARASYTTFAEPNVFDAIASIARTTNYTGVFNFDMRLAADGTIFFLECNPRFFYKMDLSLHAGVNFAAYGLRPATPSTFAQDTRVRLPKALIANLPVPWRITRRDVALMVHLLSDPLSYARENLGIDWEDRSY